jgi:Protein of unknown function (DUF2950)
MLTAQGSHAHGGAQNYIVDGKMTGGFAVVAFSRGLSLLRRKNLHRQSEWHDLRKGSRRQDHRDRFQHENL